MAEKAFRELRDMQATGTLCDVTLKGAEDSSAGIPCHRNILSAHSSYFRTMFTTDLKERSESSIRLKNISTSTLKDLVDYAYTMEIKIDAHNVEPLLTAALFLDLVAVVDLCWTFVEKHMDVGNCLMVHCLADRHHNTRLAAKAKAMVLRNFALISQLADFLLIDGEKVTELIASDNLRVDKEDDVLEAVLRWLHHDPAERQAHLSLMLQFVRVVFLGPNALEKYFLALFNGFLSTAAVDSTPSRITDALPNRLAEAVEARCRPRESYGLRKAVVCAGEWEDADAPSVDVFIPSSSSVLCIASLPDHINAPGLAVLEDGSLLACGGRSGPDAELQSEGRVWRYEQARNGWTEVSPMRQPRYGMGVATWNGCIYAVGGADLQAQNLSSVESYNPQENRWQFVADLPEALTEFAMVVFDNRLFVFGGTNSHLQSVNSAYSYDPVANMWTKLADMPTARCACSACVDNSGIVYVIGGEAEDGRCVEVYNTATDQWQKRRGTIGHRDSAVSACLGGRIFVMGGMDKSIEYYNEDTDVWTLHSCQLPHSKFLSGGAVMTMKSAGQAT
ncbi:kelch-like protein diablo [Paramacrobiotus metropolitanus]|uniref:kelch-like protein diablo n=1 Tax=Paramacrobiotus metropolitanus TaxID=2943436 RepID=UPI002445C478|nr:kelch-like protein diablo [Paramacrobiotus metropolitanus]